VLSQTFRTLIHSRLEIGMAAYKTKFPDADVVLFEPDSDDHRMFFTNIFGFSERRAVADHAYRATRRELLRRAPELAPQLAKHGITLRTDLLEDLDRDLWKSVGPGVGRHPRKESTSDVADRLDSVLDRLDAWMDTQN
jgi:hypothetical protein